MFFLTKGLSSSKRKNDPFNDGGNDFQDFTENGKKKHVLIPAFQISGERKTLGS